jgi:hypothetical protein
MGSAGFLMELVKHLSAVIVEKGRLGLDGSSDDAVAHVDEDVGIKLHRSPGNYSRPIV